MTLPTFLMVDPANFEVAYAINPWMSPRTWDENRAGWSRAARDASWTLATTLRSIGAYVEILPGIAGAPDLVFPANAAVVLDGEVNGGRGRAGHPARLAAAGPARRHQ